MCAAAIARPCASLACQFMLGLQVTEAFVLSLPVYLLLYEKVQSGEEQHAMVQQQPGAARDFRSGAYSPLPATTAPDQRPAAAAAAARIRDQTNTPAMTPLEERNALMGRPSTNTRTQSNRRKEKKARQKAARRARLDVLSAQDPAPKALSAGSVASLSDSSSSPQAARSIQSCKSRIE